MDAGQTTSYIDENGQKKTGIVAPSYNKDTDYAKYMQRAAADGDMGAASYYESQRNKKIAGEGMDYSPSSLYAQYAKQYTQDEMNRLESGYTPSYNVGTDYAGMVEKAAKNGDYAAAAYYEQQRNKKIAGEGITQYQPEYTYQKYAKDYDDAQRAELERGYRTAAEKAQETGYLESTLNMLQEQLKQQLAANETESAKQTELAMLKLQQQKEEAKKKYDSTDRQLYIDMMKEQKALPEQLAGAGYTGGATESSLLKNRLSYEQALRENEGGRASAMTALDVAGNAAELQRQIAKSQADQTARSNYLTNYSNVMSGLQGQRNYEREQELERKQQEISYALAAADNLAKYGDFSGYEKVTDSNGNRLYTDAQIAAMKAEYDALKAASTRTRSTGGGYGYGGYSYGDYSYTAPSEPTETISEDQARSLSWDQDEGTFDWNGKTYSKISDLVNAWNNVSLSDEDEAVLRRKFKAQTGVDLSAYGY